MGFTLNQTIRRDKAQQPEQAAARYKTQDIHISKIYPNAHNFYSTGKIEALASSIEQYGLLQNLEVIYDPCDKGEYRLIAGESRLRALRLLVERGEDRFSVATCKLSAPKDTATEIVELIVANGYRDKTLMDQILEVTTLTTALSEIKKQGGEIKGYNLHKGKLRDTVAQMLNMATGKIGELTKIYNSLIADFMLMVKDGQLSQNTAYALARCPEDLQRELYIRFAGGETLTAADVDRLRDGGQRTAGGSPEEGNRNEDGPAAGTQGQAEIQAAGEPGEDGSFPAAGIEVPEEIGLEYAGKMCQSATPSEQTEEQRYNAEQARIDRKTKQRLQEQEDAEKLAALPSTREPEVPEERIPHSDYTKTINGDLPVIIRKVSETKGYKAGQQMILHSYRDGEPTGKDITVIITDIIKDHTGITDGWCIILFKVLIYDNQTGEGEQ